MAICAPNTQEAKFGKTKHDVEQELSNLLCQSLTEKSNTHVVALGSSPYKFLHC